ncbi:ATP-binding protein [Nocardioides sp. SOB77]|uniref:ATP-binding protein n=1 Tax=Nocardioides oceani TaxID=3058369 RepID=A0ABT8FCE4_9ACTN|nr:ATP-binding protein [Nocardioides oceani]MDN4172259.1 ATP-binding protein [Nocardioides oceani]
MTEEITISSSEDTIDVTPHPRLLAVLGDIEFAPWQCLAELVDNAFDDFLVAPPEGETPRVAISLPGRNSNRRDAQVWITDNGRGMSLEHLTGAVSAGWTSNARYGKLGLFGMGFNIATARLGGQTTVRTTRAGDPDWLSVTLDLKAMEAKGDFAVPVVREPKDDPSLHGTEVVVSRLKQEQFDALSRQQTRIRGLLGDVYSYLLREKGFSLLVDNTAAQPRWPCVWNKDRYVVVRNERVPAFVEIDRELTPLTACQDCGRWQDLGVQTCQECSSHNLEVRERRIRGWLGIQRYSHKTDFGVDFLRNGRKILIRDVSLFAWVDPNEPGARAIPEYPIEVPNEGRIVGEIHLDHVRVDYQKTAFEYESPEWKYAVRQLRGEGPLRPKHAKDAGYEVNESPIGRLFTAYRRLDPGLRSLVPGDGTKAMHQKARDWADEFRKGNEEYQDDHVWYEAARQHDEPKVVVPPEATDPSTDDDQDVSSRLDIPEPTDAATSPNDEPPPVRETEDQKQARYRSAGEVLLDISGEYSLLTFGTWKVTVYGLTNIELVDGDARRVPVYVQSQRGSEVHVFVDFGHALFTEFGGDPREHALVGIADFMRERRGSSASVSSIVADLKVKCLPDQRVTPDALAAVAHSLLGRVRSVMRPVIAGNAEGFWSLVGKDDQDATEQRYAREGLDIFWDTVRLEGDWVTYAPATALTRLMQQRPGDFLDGKVFRPGYAAFVDPHARSLSVGRIAGYLNDVGLLAERRTPPRPDDLSRGRLSCRLLESELSEAALDD